MKHCYFDDVRCLETISCEKCIDEQNEWASAWIKYVEELCR